MDELSKINTDFLIHKLFGLKGYKEPKPVAPPLGWDKEKPLKYARPEHTDLFSKKSAEKEAEERARLPATPLDFESALQSAGALFKNQLMLSTNAETPTDFKKLEINNSKAKHFLQSIHNILHASHLKELIQTDSQKFKREEELKALNPLLSGFQLAGIAANKSVDYILKQLETELSTYDGVETKEDGSLTEKYQKIAWLQEASKNAIDNLNKIANGVNKVIQLERFSGGRAWGSRTSGAVNIQEELMENDIEIENKSADNTSTSSDDPSKPYASYKPVRKLSDLEFKSILKNSTREQINTYKESTKLADDAVIEESDVAEIRKQVELELNRSDLDRSYRQEEAETEEGLGSVDGEEIEMEGLDNIPEILGENDIDTLFIDDAVPNAAKPNLD